MSKRVKERALQLRRGFIGRDAADAPEPLLPACSAEVEAARYG